ncbi:sensor histidine kinase [Dokdonia donghaensis]|uniref:histidine kinase n=1 Tax=Dokdonia donghaensis DSW-1 TaxID=1300343 RepID=A0A0A2H4G7_9FLAO|nr:histidine kinase dimerization/phospho-acceptor domain-containing protein [Dokdonia donghaensis]ANH60260.1 sensory histidine kinase CreC [Dokdonia donghaensis DSW-1]KGO07545.1 hypothetical protein NV36_12335 [Dokdonia donghaensis DSW-1]
MASHSKKIQETINVAAHDMKNPIATMRMGAEIMSSFSEDTFVKRQADTILHCTYDLERLINIYSDYVRLQAQEPLILVKQECDESFIKAIAKKLQRLELLSERSVTISHLEKFKYLYVDKNRMITALEILTATVITYAKPASNIIINLTENKDVLKLEISFNPAQTLHCAPETLFDFSYITQRKQERLEASLELFVASEIIKAHDGNITYRADDHAVITSTLSRKRVK